MPDTPAAGALDLQSLDGTTLWVSMTQHFQSSENMLSGLPKSQRVTSLLLKKVHQAWRSGLDSQACPVLTMGQNVVIHRVHAEAIHTKKVQANKQRNDVFVVYVLCWVSLVAVLTQWVQGLGCEMDMPGSKLRLATPSRDGGGFRCGL